MIQIDQLNYAYGHKQVLKNIHLEFPENQFSVILGRNGCGKSTLFKLMAGLEPVKDGLIRYSGKPLSDFKGKDRAALLGFYHSFIKPYFHFWLKMW